MNKEKEERLEELKNIKEITEKNHPGYLVRDVEHYDKKVEIVNEDGEVEEYDLIVASIQNAETKEGYKLYYLDGKEIPIIEFLKNRKLLESIQKVIDETQKNADKPEEEQDAELKKESLKELEEEKKKEDKEETAKEEGDVQEETEEIKDLKISNLKGEVDLEQQVKGETLRKILDLGEDFDSIAPVRADSIGVPSNSEYVFVAIRKDKTCVVIGEDKIVEDRQKGENPDEKDLKVNNDGRLTEESSLANFRIVNRTNFVMSVRYDENSSTRETTISYLSGRESRDEEVAQELHKEGDRRIDDDAREALREKNGIGASDDMSKKQEEYEKAGCENKEVENIDDDKSNDTHIHFVVTRDTEVPEKDGMTVEQWADELGENPDVIVDRLQREVDKDDGRTLEDKVKEIESDYEMAGHEPKH